MQNERDGGDRVVSPQKLPEMVNLALNENKMQNQKRSYSQTSKMQIGAKDAGLFENRLKSTEMVVEQVKNGIFKEEKKAQRERGAMKKESKSPPVIKKVKSQEEQRAERKLKMEKIRKQQDRLQRKIRGEEVSTDSEEVQAKIDEDNLEDDLGPEKFDIPDKEVLLKEDRNNLVKHKTYE